MVLSGEVGPWLLMLEILWLTTKCCAIIGYDRYPSCSGSVGFDLRYGSAAVLEYCWSTSDVCDSTGDDNPVSHVEHW